MFVKTFIKMIIYKATNIVNGKIYIGQTTLLLQGRILNHKLAKSDRMPFHLAIRKYGFENFEFEVLCQCNSISELNEKEKEYIKLFNSRNQSIGYNISGGGNCFGSGEGHPCFGKAFTEEHKEKISKALTGIKRPYNSGEKNHSFGKFGVDSVCNTADKTKYKVYHWKTKILEIITKSEFRRKYNLATGTVSAIFDGKHLQSKGWSNVGLA